MKVVRLTLRYLILAVLLTQLAACSHSPIRNPFKGRPSAKLGPLPQMEAKSTSMVVLKETSTKGAGHFTKIKPQVTSQAIYQADHNGLLVATDKSGQQIWKRNTGLPVSSGPSIYGKALFVGTSDARVVAFSALDGQKLWEAKVTSEVLAPPEGNGEVLLVNTIDGQLTALDLSNGHKLWSYERSLPSLTLRGGSSPVVAENQALAGFANGKFVALDLKNGSMVWEKTISTPRGRSELHRMVDIHATPVVMGDNVYVATYQGHVVSINLTTGQVNWERQISSYRDIQVDSHAVYITDKEHQLWALDRTTGSTLWKQAALEKRVITGPALSSEYLVVGDKGGYVHWLSKKDGSLVGRRSLGKQILQTPVSDGQTVYITNSKGELTGLRFSPMESGA